MVAAVPDVFYFVLVYVRMLNLQTRNRDFRHVSPKEKFATKTAELEHVFSCAASLRFHRWRVIDWNRENQNRAQVCDVVIDPG